MNSRQRYSLVIGLFIIFIMILIPPWESLGYGLIFDPPNGAEGIDYSRLAVQIALAAIFSAAMFIVSKPEKIEQPDDSQSTTSTQQQNKTLTGVFGVFALALVAVLGTHYYTKHQEEVAAEKMRIETEAAYNAQQETARVQAQKVNEQKVLQEKAYFDAAKARFDKAATNRQWRIERPPSGVTASLQTHWKDNALIYRFQLRGAPDALEEATAGGRTFSIALLNADGLSQETISVDGTALRSYRDSKGVLSILASDNASIPCSLETYEGLRRLSME